MFKSVLSSATDMGIWPITGLLIFVAVFLATTVRAFRMDKKEAARMARLPLDELHTDPDIGRGDESA